MAKAKGEITIDERYCQGCGYCVHFCNRDCIVIKGNKYTPQGYLLPEFANPDNCTACAICAWMCPQFAIEVYKYTETKVPTSSGPKALK